MLLLPALSVPQRPSHRGLHCNQQHWAPPSPKHSALTASVISSSSGLKDLTSALLPPCLFPDLSCPQGLLVRLGFIAFPIVSMSSLHVSPLPSWLCVLHTGGACESLGVGPQAFASVWVWSAEEDSSPALLHPGQPPTSMS